MIIEEHFLDRILFLDVETVPLFADYSDLPDRWKNLWDHKAKFLKADPEQEPDP